MMQLLRLLQEEEDLLMAFFSLNFFEINIERITDFCFFVGRDKIEMIKKTFFFYKIENLQFF
jgi:hypothetical protein